MGAESEKEGSHESGDMQKFDDEVVWSKKDMGVAYNVGMTKGRLVEEPGVEAVQPHLIHNHPLKLAGLGQH